MPTLVSPSMGEGWGEGDLLGSQIDFFSHPRESRPRENGEGSGNPDPSENPRLERLYRTPLPSLLSGAAGSDVVVQTPLTSRGRGAE